MTRIGMFLMVLAVGASFSSTARAQHEGDLWVGVSGGGQLKLSPLAFVPEHAGPVVLPPSSGLLEGWSDIEPGLDHVVVADPEHDTYPMEPGAAIWLEIVAIDPALLIWDVQFKLYDEPGEQVSIGSSDLHTHLVWHIYSKSPVFDPLRVHWRATLRLLDTGGTAYSTSADFTIVFANVECVPADVDGDGEISAFDIDPFVAVLVDPAGATPAQRCAADTNLDGIIDAFDIDPFVALLTE